MCITDFPRVRAPYGPITNYPASHRTKKQLFQRAHKSSLTWQRQTMSTSVASMSTTLPLPSSPHWAPSTTVTFDANRFGTGRLAAKPMPLPVVCGALEVMVDWSGGLERERLGKGGLGSFWCGSGVEQGGEMSYEDMQPARVCVERKHKIGVCLVIGRTHTHTQRRSTFVVVVVVYSRLLRLCRRPTICRYPHANCNCQCFSVTSFYVRYHDGAQWFRQLFFLGVF